MRVGVDLDNTLICYDEPFLAYARKLQLIPDSWAGKKNEIRQYIMSQTDGDDHWQKLQGLVYSKGISEACLFPGVYRFLWRCNIREITVEVVSHKSEFGHFDKDGVSLRQVALEFLEKSAIFSGTPDTMLNSVEFCSTQKEKITRISRNNYDWFIDDLPEIVESEEFPESTKTLGFDSNADTDFGPKISLCSWDGIGHYLLGNWRIKELLTTASRVADKEAILAEWIGAGGNAGVVRVKFIDGTEAAMKIYPNDIQHDRLYSEYVSTKILRKYKETKIPKGIGFCNRLNVALYSWIEGQSVKYANTDHIGKIIEFLGRLHSLCSKTEFQLFPRASAAVSSGSQLETQFWKRLALLRERSESSTELVEFLDVELMPVAQTIIQWFRSQWEQDKYNQAIHLQDHTLSPSDFGFHNILRNPEGELIFIDFEYFGWDDPAKLIGDFLLHPAMQLDDGLKSEFVAGAESIYGSNVIERLKIMWPVLGLCWCLIILNEFRSDLWVRRIGASGTVTANSKVLTLDNQLNKSRAILEMVKLNYQNFPFYD